MSDRRGRPVDKPKGQVGLRRVTGGPASPVKRGDRVKFKAFFMIGIVRRVARNGSWIDVDWGTWTKRQRLPATGLSVLSPRFGAWR